MRAPAARANEGVRAPCSIGYLSVRMPRLDCASSPTYESFWPMPTITPGWRGRPITDGKTARGASSPAKPAFTMPEPLSHTRAATSSSAIVSLECGLLCERVCDAGGAGGAVSVGVA